MRNLDFSSWQAVLSTLIGLAVITLIGVGIRLLFMQVVQQRRERENRQVNERLRTLIAAYKTLGGSFTGDLAVDPTHLRGLRQSPTATAVEAALGGSQALAPPQASSDRSRRIRDAVEAALSDIILLGTEDQVRLAAAAAAELVAGRPVHTAALVVSLRSFVRDVLDLDPVPADVSIPKQGPARPGAAKPESRREEGGKSGPGGGGGAGMAAGGGLAAGAGLGVTLSEPDHDAEDSAR
jgi:heme exporter protein D